MDYTCACFLFKGVRKEKRKHPALTTSDAFQLGVTENQLNRCQRLIISSSSKPKFIVLL